MNNLINCPDCGNPTSKTANICPKCGKTIKTSPVNVLAMVILLIGALIAAGFIFKSVDFSTAEQKTPVRGEISITENGRSIPLETIMVRFYDRKSVETMNADDLAAAAPEIMATTDAEGKFTVSIPDGDYTAVADASRAVDKQIRYYRWKLPLTATGGEIKLILNDNNLTAE